MARRGAALRCCAVVCCVPDENRQSMKTAKPVAKCAGCVAMRCVKQKDKASCSGLHLPQVRLRCGLVPCCCLVHGWAVRHLALIKGRLWLRYSGVLVAHAHGQGATWQSIAAARRHTPCPAMLTLIEMELNLRGKHKSFSTMHGHITSALAFSRCYLAALLAPFSCTICLFCFRSAS